MNASMYLCNTTLSSTIIYEYLYGEIVSRIIHLTVIVFIIGIGPLLCTVIVLYEYIGADRRKVTIINRLRPPIYINIALQSLIWGIVRIFRDILGLLPYALVTPLLALSQILLLSALLLATELTVFRFVFIVVWKRVKPFDDEFWSLALMIVTHLVAVSFLLTISFVGGHSYDMTTIIEVTDKQDIRYSNVICYIKQY